MAHESPGRSATVLKPFPTRRETGHRHSSHRRKKFMLTGLERKIALHRSKNDAIYANLATMTRKYIDIKQGKCLPSGHDDLFRVHGRIG
jgi:hypothetical protein